MNNCTGLIKSDLYLCTEIIKICYPIHASQILWFVKFSWNLLKFFILVKNFIKILFFLINVFRKIKYLNVVIIYENFPINKTLSWSLNKKKTQIEYHEVIQKIFKLVNSSHCLLKFKFLHVLNILDLKRLKMLKFICASQITWCCVAYWLDTLLLR